MTNKKKAKSSKLRTTMYLCSQCYPKRVWDIEAFDAEIPHACPSCGSPNLQPLQYCKVNIEYDPNAEDEVP